MKWGTWYLVSEPRSLQAWCCVLEEPDGNALPSCTTQLCWKAKLKRAKWDNNKTHPLGSLWFQGQQHRNLFYSTHIGLPVSHTEHTHSHNEREADSEKSLCLLWVTVNFSSCMSHILLYAVLRRDAHRFLISQYHCQINCDTPAWKDKLRFYTLGPKKRWKKV